MPRWLLVPISFAAGALALVVAPTVSAHRLTAWGAPECAYPPCADTRVEGHYTNGGVPGVDANYSFFNTSVDSDNGHSSIDAGWSWLEGTAPGSFNMADVIEENVDLARIAPGPIIVRATLLLRRAAQISGTGIVQLNAQVSFPGCEVYATQYLFNGGSQDPEIIGGDCAALGERGIVPSVPSISCVGTLVQTAPNGWETEIVPAGEVDPAARLLRSRLSASTGPKSPIMHLDPDAEE